MDDETASEVARRFAEHLDAVMEETRKQRLRIIDLESQLLVMGTWKQEYLDLWEQFSELSARVHAANYPEQRTKPVIEDSGLIGQAARKFIGDCEYCGRPEHTCPGCQEPNNCDYPQDLHAECRDLYPSLATAEDIGRRKAVEEADSDREKDETQRPSSAGGAKHGEETTTG